MNYAFFFSIFVYEIHWWTLTLNSFSIIPMRWNVLLVKDGSRLSSKHFRVSVFWQVCIVKAGGEVLKTLLFFCFGIAVNSLVFLSSEEILWKGFTGALSLFG